MKALEVTQTIAIHPKDLSKYTTDKKLYIRVLGEKSKYIQITKKAFLDYISHVSDPIIVLEPTVMVDCVYIYNIQ
jgi:hypothetical protein